MTFKKKLVAVVVKKIFIVKKKGKNDTNGYWKKHC